MQILNLVALLNLLSLTVSFHAVPLVLSSHKLVKGIKTYIPDITARQNGETVTNMLKKLITDCSSDEYIILDIPGLKYDDLNDQKIDNWPFLTKYLSMSSTTLGLSFVNDVIDLNFIKHYIVNNCDAEILNANINDEGTINYIDARTKVINIKFNELNHEDKFIRDDQIFRNDEFIRKIIRKLPSPHYTIILTSSKPVEITPTPKSIITSQPAKYNIFNKIINDDRRNIEVELHDNFKSFEPLWIDKPNPIMSYIHNKEKDIIKFLNYELWIKHEQLIMTMLIMIMTVIMIKFKQLFGRLTTDKKEKLP